MIPENFSIQFQGKLTGDLIIMHTVIPGTGWQKDSGRMGECMGLDAIWKDWGPTYQEAGADSITFRERQY